MRVKGCMGTNLSLVPATTATSIDPVAFRAEIGELRALQRALDALTSQAERAAEATRHYGISDAYREERLAEAEAAIRMMRTLVASAHRRQLRRQLKK